MRRRLWRRRRLSSRNSSNHAPAKKGGSGDLWTGAAVPGTHRPTLHFRPARSGGGSGGGAWGGTLEAVAVRAQATSE